MINKEREEYNKKNREYYHRNSKRINRKRREYYLKNNEEAKRKRREHYFKNNEEIRMRKNQYYYKNKKRFNEYSKKWYQKNRDKILEKQKKYYLENRDRILEYNRKNKEIISKKISLNNLRIKKLVLGHYSNGKLKCVRCGFSDIRALSIDHINGGGTLHRKQIRGRGSMMYRWLIKNNFPKGYMTLCMNCNIIKRFTNHENIKFINDD